MEQTGEKFFSKEEIKKAAESWKKAANESEGLADVPTATGGIFAYTVNRKANNIDARESVEKLHQTQFLKEIIPNMIASKKEGQKVKILIVGAGVGVFTEEIRQAFGDKVQVYSTGLSKKAVIEYRKKDFRTLQELDLDWKENYKKFFPEKSLPLNLDNKDLKWRSISELSDYEEFDLIIDTYGEQYYMTFSGEYMVKTFKKYLLAVAKKLKPGGLASIHPVREFSIIGDTELTISEEVEKEMSVKIEIDARSDKTLTMTKPLK